VGFELVTPSISSPSFARGLALSGRESKGKRSFLQKFYNFIGDNYTRAPWVEKIFDHKLKKLNPHFTDFGAIYYGYMVVELEADFCTWWLYHSDPAVPPEQFVGKELVRCQRYWPAEAKVESLDLKPPP
jgi:hypothetical protein